MDKEAIDKYGLEYGELEKLVEDVERMLDNLKIDNVHGEANHIVCHCRNVCEESMYAKFESEVARLKIGRDSIEAEIRKELIEKLKGG